eukprot:g4078.t1
MGLVESLAFPAPRTDLSEAALRAAESMRLVPTARGDRVPLVVEAAPDAPYCIIYSHGNAVDLGLILPFLANLRAATGCTVIGFEYPGYSISEPRGGRPTEAGCYAAIDSAYAHATGPCGFEPERIVLYGRSLGTGPTIDLSSRLGHRIAGTILMSPLTSAVRTQLGETMSRMLSRMDIFKSIHKIGSVKSPTFVMHGESDGVVPCSNGRALYRMLPPEAKVFAPWWAKRRGHNDMPEAEVLRRVSDFMQALKQRRESNGMR